jgi:hypothetical protein
MMVGVACRLLLGVGKCLLPHELSRFRKFLCVVQVESDGSSVEEDKVVVVVFLLLSSSRSGDLRLDLTPPVAVSRARLTVTIVGLDIGIVGNSDISNVGNIGTVGDSGNIGKVGNAGDAMAVIAAHKPTIWPQQIVVTTLYQPSTPMQYNLTSVMILICLMSALAPDISESLG